jgi:hypothetical protein
LGYRSDGIGGAAYGFGADTLRPSDPLEKAQQLLQKTDHGAVLVTDSDGKLLGAFFGTSNNAEAGREQQGPAIRGPVSITIRSLVTRWTPSGISPASFVVPEQFSGAGHQTDSGFRSISRRQI